MPSKPSEPAAQALVDMPVGMEVGNSNVNVVMPPMKPDKKTCNETRIPSANMSTEANTRKDWGDCEYAKLDVVENHACQALRAKTKRQTPETIELKLVQTDKADILVLKGNIFEIALVKIE